MMKNIVKILTAFLLIALFLVSCGIQKQQKITNSDLQVLADDAQEEIDFKLDD